MPEFLVATMVRQIRRVVKARVSRSAALELSSVLEDYGLRVSKEALKLAEHRGAKTMNKEDIKVAVAVIPR